MSRAGLAAGWAGAAWSCAYDPRSPSLGALPSFRTIGLQLSTVRELFTRDLAATLRDVARVGYRTVETSADLPQRVSAPELRALLDAAGLRSPVGLYRYAFLQQDLPAVIASAHTLAQEYVGLPSLGDAPHSTRTEYLAVAEQLNSWGLALGEADLRLTYHNHAADFDRLDDGSTGYDLLLEHSDPDLVAFELDLQWMDKAGHDPAAYIQRHPGRFPLFHLRDSTPAPEKRFAPVGEGVMDYPRLLSYAGMAGMRHAFVETVRPEDPLESIRRSYVLLAEMLPA